MGRLYNQFQVTAGRRGRCVAVISKEKNISFEDFLDAVDRSAAELAAAGIRQGMTVLTDISRPQYYLAALLALNKIGASIVVGRFSASDRIRTKTDFKLTDEFSPPEKHRGAVVMKSAWWEAANDTRQVTNAIDSDGIRHVFATSGSTGQIKYITVSERNLLNRLKVDGRDFIDGDTRLLCTIGAQTTFATELHLGTLLKGGSIVLLPLQSDYLAHYIDLFAVTVLITTPLIMDDLVTLAFPRKLYRTLNTVVMSGAAASRGLIDNGIRHVSDHVVLTYGNSELGAIAKFAYDPSTHRPGIVGKIFPDIEIEIVDEDSTPVAPGAEGQIRFRRENTIAELGYANTDELQGERFSDGWFYPGDMGRLEPDGDLVITGRDDNVINVGGNKFAIEFIEQEIETKMRCRCVVLREADTRAGEAITLVVSADRKLGARLFQKFVQKNFPRLDLAAVYQTEAVATTESGKKDRAAVAGQMETEAASFQLLN